MRIADLASDLASSETRTVEGGSPDKPVAISRAVDIRISRLAPGVVTPEGAKPFDEEPD